MNKKFIFFILFGFILKANLLAIDIENYAQFKSQALDDYKSTNDLGLSAYNTAKQASSLPSLTVVNYYYELIQDYNDNKDLKAYFCKLLTDDHYWLDGIKCINENQAAYDKLWFYEHFADQLYSNNYTKEASAVIENGLSKFNSLKLKWLQALIMAKHDQKKAYELVESLPSDNLDDDEIDLKFTLLLSNNRLQQAGDLLISEHNKNPDDKELISKLLLFYLQAKEDSNFEQLAAESVQKFPNHAIFYYLSANYYSLKPDFQMASDNINLAIENDKDNENYLIFKVKLYVDNGKQDDIYPTLKSLVDKNVNDISLYHLLARYYIDKQLPFSAEEVALKGLSNFFFLNAQSSQAYLQLVSEYAMISEQVHNYKLANDAYKSMIGSSISQAFVYFGIARTAYHLDLITEADVNIEKALELTNNQDSENFYQEISNYYIEQLIKNKSIAKAQKLITELNVRFNDKQLINQAVIYIYYKQYKLALDNIKLYRSGDATEDSNRVKYLKALCYEGLFDYKNLLVALESIKTGADDVKRFIDITKFRLNNRYLKDAIAKNNEYDSPSLAFIELQAYLDKSYRLREWKKSKAVLKLFEQIIKGQDISKSINSAPKNWKAYLLTLQQAFSLNETLTTKIASSKANQLWMAYYQHFNLRYNNDKQAFNPLLQALPKNKNNPLLNGLVLPYFIAEEEDYNSCVDSAKSYLSKYKESIWAKIEIAICYDSLKEGKLAEGTLKDALEQDGENATIYNNLAWLYLTSDDESLRNSKLALDYAKFATDEQPSAAFLDTLAEAYYQTKDYVKARLVIQRALFLDYTNSDHFRRQYRKIEQALETDQN